MSSPYADKIAATWFEHFGPALEASDISKVLDAILPDGWLRDVLVFSWDWRTLSGHAEIAKYLSTGLQRSKIRNVAMDKDRYIQPLFFPAGPNVQGVECSLTFETDLFKGRIFSRLMPVDGPDQAWKALTVAFFADELQGSKELGYESGLYSRERQTYTEALAKKHATIEADPYTIIIGAGQTGLQVAIRFKQMNIPTIIIERNAKVGDNWRKRYPSVTLHTPRHHHQFLHNPFPKNWPMYTPRDKLASWMKHVSEAEELVVWTSSSITGKPIYSEREGRWTVEIQRKDRTITIRPAHIVLATGHAGDPYIPSIKGLNSFAGPVIHSNAFPGGAQFTGQEVVVLGAGNSAADMCQELVHYDAKEVTMVQRSATNVVSSQVVTEMLNHVWPPEGEPVHVGDYRSWSMPMLLLKQLRIQDQARVEEFDKEMLDGLRRQGFNWTSGPDAAGQLLMVFERGGGYWLDVGCSELIADGRVKVKQGSEISHITQNAIILKDGTELPADVIIAATGYLNIRDSLRHIFGAEVIDRTSPVWGLNEEGELRGIFRPSGYPGLWYAAGDFPASRFYSKSLALCIKAIQTGIISSTDILNKSDEGSVNGRDVSSS